MFTTTGEVKVATFRKVYLLLLLLQVETSDTFTHRVPNDYKETL